MFGILEHFSTIFTVHKQIIPLPLKNLRSSPKKVKFLDKNDISLRIRKWSLFFFGGSHRSFLQFLRMGEVEATIRSLRLRAAISTLELEANELPNSEDVTRAQPGALAVGSMGRLEGRKDGMTCEDGNLMFF